MTGLPFITEFFTNVLSKSTVMEGPLIYCARMGAEVNFEEFDQVIAQAFAGRPAKAYPVPLMMPPLIRGNFTNEDWDRYQFTLFFLTSTFYDPETGTTAPNPDTQTSTHTILQDQHDMIRAAKDFLSVIDQVSRRRAMVNSSFRLGQRSEKMITPVALIGVDRLSGARLDFDATVFTGCKVEDYTTDAIDEIVIPEADTHPEHTQNI